MFIAVLFAIAKIWKQPECPLIGEWTKRKCDIHTQWNIIQPLKNNEILPFATTWMDLEGIMLNEISWPEKDKYHVISLICGIQ